LETNGALGSAAAAVGVVGLGVAVAAAAVTADIPYMAAPTTPPANIDPAMVAAATVFRNPFMSDVTSF
jgi:hypothetical protein